MEMQSGEELYLLSIVRAKSLRIFATNSEWCRPSVPSVFKVRKSSSCYQLVWPVASLSRTHKYYV